jgi:phosphatidylinositol N-acetylglucosaminyltransferase subunit H
MNNNDLGFAESVIVLPSKDLELETHRGPLGRPMFVERRVIPASSISGVIINEGLYGWNVRYYLAILTKVEPRSLHVLYEVKTPSPCVYINFS